MDINNIINLINILGRKVEGDELIEAINDIKLALHEISPFKNDAVDCILWKKAEELSTIDWNVNYIAPAEKRLLYNSLLINGFTQPVLISQQNEKNYVIDGAQRYELATNKVQLKKRYRCHIPVSIVNQQVTEYDCMAISVRHNRARGKFVIPKLSTLVGELVRNGWDDDKIALELGMDNDEILRLKQIDGIKENFKNIKFSDGWTVR